MSVTLVVLAALVVATVVVGVLAVRRDNGAAVVNTVASLAVDAVAVAAAAGFQFDGGAFVAPGLAVWTALAGLLHSIGMLGPYESVWWWDHLTHTLSAALLTAFVYAAIAGTVGAAWSPTLVAVATVGYTFAAGVVWELLELVARAYGERYGVEPVLVHYGRWDSGLDLAFDLLAAVCIVAVDLRVFDPLVRTAPGVARSFVVWSTVALVAGGVLFGGFLLARRREPN